MNRRNQGEVRQFQPPFALSFTLSYNHSLNLLQQRLSSKEKQPIMYCTENWYSQKEKKKIGLPAGRWFQKYSIDAEVRDRKLQGM